MAYDRSADRIRIPPMKQTRTTERISGNFRLVRPIPAFLVVYTVLFAIGTLYVMSRWANDQSFAQSFLDFELIGMRSQVLFMLVHAIWLSLLVWEVFAVRNSPKLLRKGHLAAALCGITLVAMLELCVRGMFAILENGA